MPIKLFGILTSKDIKTTENKKPANNNTNHPTDQKTQAVALKVVKDLEEKIWDEFSGNSLKLYGDTVHDNELVALTQYTVHEDFEEPLSVEINRELKGAQAKLAKFQNLNGKQTYGKNRQMHCHLIKEDYIVNTLSKFSRFITENETSIKELQGQYSTNKKGVEKNLRQINDPAMRTVLEYLASGHIAEKRPEITDEEFQIVHNSLKEEDLTVLNNNTNASEPTPIAKLPGIKMKKIDDDFRKLDNRPIMLEKDYISEQQL